MKVLLDTNAYVALRRGDEAVAEFVRDAEKVVFSAIVAGELLHGFRNGTRAPENTKELARFLERPEVLFVPVGWDSADRFGRIATGLRKQGTPIPTNDVWIAAHAMETGADLISFDRHFAHVHGLAWILPGA
ncbi:MAG: type II toxin-antitoxin system VapC family toxin [Archangium sp.]|nr:type II toxin-antitoxin system VapC family toxin [Archangium sp.]MDP3154415.1 type II toxin-antitoxin system VapC family toxin [Archangium sp.]MDP3572980.1 type II toxin-antitoxin system VapC family toxin [Archangium sp.]